MDSRIAEASNKLGLSLYKLLAKENANVFFSPFSISTALAMLFCGAQDETAEEMRKVLGYEMANIKDGDIKHSFQTLLEAFDNKQPQSYTLNYANTVLNHKEFKVKEEFKLLLGVFFKASFQEADFFNENEETIKLVNEWVNEKTNGMIPTLLDSLDPSTVMIILNAVYFKGLWLHRFDENGTFFQNFYNKGNSKVKQIEMMHLQGYFPCVEEELFKALQLPYKGDDIFMLILLPYAKDGLNEVENSLDSSFIQDLKKTMRETRVELALPKFKLEYSKSLKDKFQSLGLNRIFGSGAHLNGINDSGELLVSEIVHKAVLVVNEEGSEAAAVTAVRRMLCASVFDPEFIVDHPFLFVIYNNKNDLILFMGRVDEL